MKTASKSSQKTTFETPELQFHFNWNPNSDSDSLKAWEEDNTEYATWNLIDDGQDSPSC